MIPDSGFRISDSGFLVLGLPPPPPPPQKTGTSLIKYGGRQLVISIISYHFICVDLIHQLATQMSVIGGLNDEESGTESTWILLQIADSGAANTL